MKAYKITSTYHLPKLHLPPEGLILDRFDCKDPYVRAVSYGGATGYGMFKLQVGPIALDAKEAIGFFEHFDKTNEIPDAYAVKYFRLIHHLISASQRDRLASDRDPWQYYTTTSLGSDRLFTIERKLIGDRNIEDAIHELTNGRSHVKIASKRLRKIIGHP